MLSIHQSFQLRSLRGKSVFFSLLLLVIGGAHRQVWATPGAYSIAGSANAAALEGTNGNKTVVAPDGTLHTVFADSGQIKYTASSDGANWTAPVVISGSVANAKSPTLAAANYKSGWGVGVAFVDVTAGVPYYTCKLAGGNWSAPVLVAGNPSYASAAQPSMVGYGSEMHLTWMTSVSTIWYAHFSVLSTTSPILNYPELVQDLCLCYYSTVVSHPSIAVAKSGPNDDKPSVRIGYWLYSSGGSYPPALRVAIAEGGQGSSGTPWPYQAMEYSYIGYMGFSGFQSQDFSLSLAANPLTGDFYVAYSYFVNANGAAKLSHNDSWSGNVWQVPQVVLPRPAQIDVASMASTVASSRLIRIAVNDFKSGNNGFGPTWFRSGQWVGGGGLNWQGSDVQVSSEGADPQAIFWYKPCYSGRMIYVNGIWREVYGFFTGKAGSNFGVQRASDEGRCFMDSY